MNTFIGNDPNDYTIPALLGMLNEHLEAQGKKPRKGWWASKIKLFELVNKTLQDAAEGTHPAAAPPIEQVEVNGHKVPVTNGHATEGLRHHLNYAEAIRFIRKHRRRRHIYVRIETTVIAEGGSPYQMVGYLRASARHAREYALAMIGDEHRKKMGHTIEFRVEPSDLVTKGKTGIMFVG